MYPPSSGSCGSVKQKRTVESSPREFGSRTSRMPVRVAIVEFSKGAVQIHLANHAIVNSVQHWVLFRSGLLFQGMCHASLAPVS